MSVSEKVDVQCPRCGKQQPATVWKSLSAADDPGIREALFGWQINVFSCLECDFRAQMPVSLLYTDPGKRFAVQYYPLDAIGTEDFYKGFGKDGEPADDDGAGARGMKPHIVFDMAEMMRYIAFREIAFEKGKG